jgi:ribonuclease P protein component
VLPQENRLKHRRDFLLVYQKGKRRQSKHLRLRVWKYADVSPSVGSGEGEATEKSPRHSPTRIGISVSQKVDKRAVVRNRFKRRIRAALRELLPQMEPGWMVVVGVRQRSPECNYEQILRELKQLLTEAEVLHGY